MIVGRSQDGVPILIWHIAISGRMGAWGIVQAKVIILLLGSQLAMNGIFEIRKRLSWEWRI